MMNLSSQVAYMTVKTKLSTLTELGVYTTMAAYIVGLD